MAVQETDQITIAERDQRRQRRVAATRLHADVPAFKARHVLREHYGWGKADRFIAAWRGFRMVGHLVLRKKYASLARFLRYQHE